MLSNREAKKIAICLRDMQSLKAKQKHFRNDKEIANLFKEVNSLLRRTVRDLSRKELQMVMNNIPEEINKSKSIRRKK